MGSPASPASSDASPPDADADADAMNAQTSSPGPKARLRAKTPLAVAFVLAGSAASAALAAIANWIAANGLGAEGFGLFSLAMAITTVLQEIGGPALDTAVVRFAGPLIKHDPRRAEVFLRAGARIKLLVSGTLAAILILSADFLASAVFDEPALAPLIYWMSLNLLAANVSTNTLARLQSSERFAAHSAFRILANGIKVLLLVGLLVTSQLTPSAAAFAWALSFVLTYIAGVLFCRAWRIDPQPQPGDHPHHDIFGFGGWVMLTGLLFAVHIRTDMLLLGHFGTPSEVGNYAVAWNMMLLLDLITSSLVLALMPKAARATSAEQLASLRKTTLMTAGGTAVALLPLYIFAEPLIHLLFRAFPDAVAPFRMLFWSSIIVLLFYPLYLCFYAKNQPAKVSAVYGVLAVSGIVAGFALIPTHGLMGAAATTLIARIAGAVAILMLLAFDRPKRVGI